LAFYNEYNLQSIAVTCVPQMTLYSSVFASPSRVIHAYLSGLDGSSRAYQLAAGKFADIKTLAKAHQLGMQYTGEVMIGAAQCNKLAEVQFLCFHNCTRPMWLLEVAARSGHFELLRWCYEHGCRFAAAYEAPHHAAKSGNLELMVRVRQHTTTQLNRNVMSAAALRGHTAMCKYLYTQQCPRDSWSTRCAAIGGHIDCFRWLLANGCPWEARQLCMAAAEGGSVEVLAHLQEQGTMTSSTAMLTEMLREAGRHDKLDALKWLRGAGAEWPSAAHTLSTWSEEVLAWAIAAGCPTVSH
jgi:hypothetical protein